MYRDDRDALVARVEALAKTEQLNEEMKRELLELRRAASMMPSGNPYRNPAVLGPAERVALGDHQLEKFPVWAAGLLHVLTFGLFSIVFYGIQQGRMPRAAQSDPTAAQSIGFSFVPFFQYYWWFFNSMRLCERITLQYQLRGSEEEAPRGLALASSILTVIPYVNLLAILFVWPVTACLIQWKINRLVDLGPVALEAGPAQPLLISG
jgi:hypothetical protein